MEPPGAWALRRAPDRLRDGLGGDDDRTEVIARVDQHRAGPQCAPTDIHALAALECPATTSLRNGAAAECRGDGEAGGPGKWDEDRRRIAGVGDER